MAPGVLESADRLNNRYVRLNGSAGAAELRSALGQAQERFGADLAGALPDVTDEAVGQLKFGDLLPAMSARATLAARALDPQGARRVLQRSLVVG